MTTADWALTLSLCSVAISLAAFIWNVWSKFIYPKPRVDVSFSYSSLIGSGGVEGDVIAIGATNMGPVEVTLYCAVVRLKRKKWWQRRPGPGLLNPLHNYPVHKNLSNGPFSGGLPKKLGVGEVFSVYLTPIHEDLACDDIDRVGFSDTFNRYHWAGKQQTKTTIKRIKDAYTAAN